MLLSEEKKSFVYIKHFVNMNDHLHKEVYNLKHLCLVMIRMVKILLICLTGAR